jgi:hypothetical protein
MRYRIGASPPVLAAAAVLLVGCVQDVPPDSGPPASASAVELRMLIHHHSTQGTSRVSDPNMGTWTQATNVMRSQCGIILSHFRVTTVENLTGLDKDGGYVKFGDQFASTTWAGVKIPSNWTLIRDRQVRRNEAFNKGGDAYYSEYIWHAGSVRGVTDSFGLNRAVLLSSTWSHQQYYDLVLPHEIGHMLNLPHNYSSTANLMYDPLWGGTNVAGRQPDGTYALSSECERARDHGLRQQFFLDQYPGYI